MSVDVKQKNSKLETRNSKLIKLLFFLVLVFPSILSSQDKMSVLWVDPLLNIRDIHTRGSISNMITKAQRAGFEAIALGMKALTGEVIYKSNEAPQLLEWRGYQVPNNFDAAKEFIEEARRRDMQIYAVFPLFSEGHMTERKGLIYDKRPEWQSQVYVVEDEEPVIIPISDWAYGTAGFGNPFSAGYTGYLVRIVREFLREYSVDGIIFDKVRFYGLETDFSEDAKRQFETFIGQSINWWPNNIYELQYVNDNWEKVPGEYYYAWLEFRASTMRKFVNRMIEEVRKVDQSIPIGVMVGGWFPAYYEYGLNWASEETRLDYEWATDDYPSTGIAELFDYMVVGNFFPRVTMKEAEDIGAEWWMSVEGSIINATEVVNRVCPLYGSLLVEQFANNEEGFTQAMRTILEQTTGLHINDASGLEKHKLWDAVTNVLVGSSETSTSTTTRRRRRAEPENPVN